MLQLSPTCRKALCVQVGEHAGSEIASLLELLVERIDRLERTKVSVTPIVPGGGNILQVANVAPE